MSGHVGGAFTSAGVILVLFILLVIVICGCMGSGLGGYGGGPSYPVVGGVNKGY
ncbi:hypothetical protein [Paenibacillus sp. CF384]|uniref:hypothetical protein n=1 Tax=Paenibacillus sp. CF384 TaxID=1884382 RepID=UPI000894E6D5|nr:hypothetical protein [Paenibacillus sp. CF384]SDW03029.1 hypothetical protein SAMN05518855_100112 [Paenibacillus sp. CF384]